MDFYFPLYTKRLIFSLIKILFGEVMKEKALLIILDGFGINKSDYGNAIKKANKPNYDKFYNENPHSELIASGEAVGLLKGDMGNSEVGHLNIGAGRIVYQLNSLIMKQIDNGDFFKNPYLLSAIEHCKKNNSNLHIFGLLSDGNVHTNINHLFALLELARRNNFNRVYYHAFMDGRDTAPDDGIRFMKILNDKIKEIGVGKIATVSGRYYAMDRDNRWERIKLAYDAIVYGKGNSANSPFEAIEESYKNNITDEFIIPTVILEKNKPICTLQDNDSVIFFNFRSDRARQLTRAIKIPSFKEFEHENFKNLKFVTFNEYDIEFNDYVDVAFRLPELKNILGEVMQNNKLKQLRLAETEKYAHVTFFFNGGVEKAFEGEDRILVPSPKVATYDLQPEMSAFEVKDKLVNALKTKDYDLIVTNFANCDMVGHTGVFDAAVKAVETIDICLGEILPVAQKKKYNIFITADHGNADQMLDENGNPFTAHSKNPVPFVVKLTSETKINLKNGILADIAPTILKAMKIEIPKEMTGKPLF